MNGAKTRSASRSLARYVARLLGCSIGGFRWDSMRLCVCVCLCFFSVSVAVQTFHLWETRWSLWQVREELREAFRVEVTEQLKQDLRNVVHAEMVPSSGDCTWRYCLSPARHLYAFVHSLRSALKFLSLLFFC